MVSDPRYTQVDSAYQVDSIGVAEFDDTISISASGLSAVEKSKLLILK